MDTAATPETVDALLPRYGLGDAAVEPVESDDGGLFRVSRGPGAFFLKLDAEATGPGVLSQLQFMDHLRQGGLPVVETIATTDGEPFAQVAGTIGLLTRAIDGPTLEATTETTAIERCGELLARLHLRSREFEPPPGFERPRWDPVFFPTEGGWLDEFFARRLVAEDAREVMARAARRSRRAVESMRGDAATYGVIHADFHGENLIDDGRVIHIIDFDDCGWGHWLSDLTWPAALVARKQGPDVDFFGPFLRGYESVRPLSAHERQFVPEFELGARLACAEMVFSSGIDQDGPRARAWYAYIVESLREQLSRMGEA